MIEHCVSELLQEQETKSYRAYVTDALMIIAENTAKTSLSGGNCLKQRWMDAIKEPDTRTGDEIAADVIKNAGLTLIGGED